MVCAHLLFPFPFAECSSVVGLIESNGTRVSTSQYDPFGNLTSTMGNIANPWRFASGYLDSSTGLYKFGARYYDPTIGRWTQQDPLRGSLDNPTSLNRYVYANDDPVNFTDPSGKDIFDCFWVWLEAAFSFIAGMTSLILALFSIGAKYETALAAAIAAGTVAETGEVIGLMAFEFAPILLTVGDWALLILFSVGLAFAAWAIANAIVHCVLHQG